MLRGEKLMATKRKFKRDYIMLEAKDMNYRFKDKVSPKAFAKVEITDEKSVIALYAENLKNVSEGYSVVVIRSDYETIDLGNFNVNNQGKGEFSFNMGDEDIDIKGIAIIQDKSVPLIGFKGSKIDNFEQILFPPRYETEEIDDDDDEYEYEEVEYIEVDDETDEDYYDEEIDDSQEDEYEYEEYEEIEYIENNNMRNNEYEYEEIIYEEIEDEYEYEEYEEAEYIEIDEKENKSTKNIRDTVKIKSDSIKMANALLMPRQIKKGLKYFREVKPFVSDYVDNTRWWKMEINPTTLCGYTMPYLGYVNTLNYTMYSDAVMNSYKYRHYLFGVQYDEYNKRQYYIYAVPGRKNEQPDKGHTGFTRYQACDNRNNSLGYWLCFVDCKARKILK